MLRPDAPTAGCAGASIAAIVQLLALAAGLPFGVTGVAIAYAIAMFALFVPALVYSGRPVGIHTSDVLRAVGPQMIGGLIAVTAGFLVQFEFLADVSPLLRIFASGMVCLLTYLAVVAGIFRITAPLQLAFSVLHDIRGFRTPADSRP